ncbi:major capsid protein [Chromobacterium violaceum]|uniref:Bacteriophage coat protein B n=2 Tax=Chromobacterium violaceum TaxID=536 RepID=A0AAX2M7H3_CHRVL|nr:major capsid protein [Chromobacterium violaceum]STB63797.1 Bacteriophage coat protein B [Chromobacterium violaceum]STB63811.1 Bacteriophage coat protein B [Chromobacterium violaceum]SUX32402.1 Bacteriophage coat protein B [Chromobacterium violaceum]SUX32416.1 Bacteriophage coat protein B [Chromobacterium violaceum]
MKFREIARRYGSRAALAAAMTTVAATALADVPEEVKTSITNSGKDAAIMGGLVLAVIVGIFGFKWMRKAL